MAIQVVHTLCIEGRDCPPCGTRDWHYTTTDWGEVTCKRCLRQRMKEADRG